MFTTPDPLAEKNYSVSPYAYCNNNPVKYIDPDGRDWYWDSDGTRQFDPNVSSQKNLRDGQTCIGRTDAVKDKNGRVIENYRKDGSIMYTNETSAYNRMWSQANDHYNQKKEVGGFTLSDGRVLITPDYANEETRCTPTKYGYNISNDGYLSKDGEKFKVTGQIHTHQGPNDDPTPSFTGESGGDIGYSKAMGGLPVMTIGNDGKIHGAYYDRGIMIINGMGSRADLLSGKTKLTPWLKTYPTKR